MFKKVIIAAMLLTAGAVSAYAEVEVSDVMNSSFTYNQVTVASAALAGTGVSNQLFSALLVSGATTFTTLLESRKVLEIHNEDASVNIRCLVDLSSTSASGDRSLTIPGALSTSYGKKIAAGQSYILGLRARDNDGRVLLPWCINDGGTGTSKIGVIQGRYK